MKIAIYTCITGGYDDVKPPHYVEDDCDYYLISDDITKLCEPYKWIDVDCVISADTMSDKDKNRYCKMHPFDIFPQYDYSIYVDGSIQIIGNISENIKKTGTLGLAMHRHRCTDDVYEEGVFLSWLGVTSKDKVCDDICRYVKSGLPRHFGMFECGMIVTDLHNLKAHEIYGRWYDEYKIGAGRDQQALVYVLWTLGYRSEDIGDLGNGYNIFTNPEICWNRSIHYQLKK